MEVPMHIRPEENYYVFSKEITFSLAEKKKLISERPFFFSTGICTQHSN
jgi:hypothetical protein